MIKQAVTKFKDGIELICLGEGFFDLRTLTNERTATDTLPLPSPNVFFYTVALNLLRSIGVAVE